MPGKVKSRDSRYVLQVWHFTFGLRGEIFPVLRSLSAKTVGSNITGTYTSLDFERAAIKDTICRHLLIVWEHLLYYSSRLVQILFQDVTSGNFEVFFLGKESVVQKLSPFMMVTHRNQTQRISLTK